MVHWSVRAGYEVVYRYENQRVTPRYTPDMTYIFGSEAVGSITPVHLIDKQDDAFVKRDKVRLAGGED